LRILQDFAGFCRGILLKSFGVSIGLATHNPSVVGSSVPCKRQGVLCQLFEVRGTTTLWFCARSELKIAYPLSRECTSKTNIATSKTESTLKWIGYTVGVASPAVFKLRLITSIHADSGRTITFLSPHPIAPVFLKRVKPNEFANFVNRIF
jgi:hypothetical protein